jgi:hypothetical protein
MNLKELVAIMSLRTKWIALKRVLKINCSYYVFIVACGISVLFTAGCKNYICSNNQILTAFVGYSQNDIDSFTLRRYKANDSFHLLIDTFEVINAAVSGSSGNAVYSMANDTTIVVYVNNGNPGSGIYAGYDWQVYLPVSHQTVHINNIIVPNSSGVEPCNNALLSYVQDSVLVSAPYYPVYSQQYTSGYWIYIKP